MAGAQFRERSGIEKAEPAPPGGLHLLQKSTRRASGGLPVIPALKDTREKDLGGVYFFGIHSALGQQSWRQGDDRAMRVGQYLIHHALTGNGGKSRGSLRTQHHQVGLLSPCLLYTSRHA